MLEHYGLTYIIKDEVLKITSKDTVNRERVTRTYNVKDLVLPIPNFVSDYNSGLAGALRSAYEAHSSTLLVKTDEVSSVDLRNERLARSGLA